ncbi:MAG: MurR/RpiR family transcriptional regulator [Eubacteriaceae bacterium]|jgi:RpiR family carbohydrate utilization transcriptional regulator
MASLLSDLRTKYNTFSKTQKKIADHILSAPEDIVLQSITDLASSCNTSETTVMRLLKKLDYDSYQVFRIDLARDLSDSPKESFNEELTEEDTLESIKEKVIRHTVTSIQDLSNTLSDESLAKALDMIQKAKRILFFGVGASAAIAMDAMHKFGNIGLNVCSYPDSHLMNIICSHTTPDDLFIGISHTGESMEVLSAATIARSNGTAVIAMTSFDNSSLAQLADLTLLSSTNDKKYHSEAMASRIIQLTIVDILFISLFMQDEEKRYKELTKSRIAVSFNKT